MLNKYGFIYVFRVLVSFLLIFSSIIKAINPEGFYEFMFNLGVQNNLHLYLYFITFLELTIGILLFIGFYYKYTLLFITFLFTVFGIIHIYGMVSGIEECACTGGILFQKIGVLSILMNLSIATISFLIDPDNDKFAIDNYFEFS